MEAYVMRVPEPVKFVLIIERGQTYPLGLVGYDIVQRLLEGPHRPFIMPEGLFLTRIS